MAVQLVNIGNSANDGTGDDLREAFVKVNTSLTSLSDSIVTGNNTGSSGAEVFKDKTGSVLNFRRLVAGTSIALTELENTILIDNTAASYVISTDSGSIIAGDDVSYTITGNGASLVSADENTKTITISSLLSQESSPQLGADLNAQSFNITNAGSITSSVLSTATGNITNLIPISLNSVSYTDRLGRYIEGFDFGDITFQAQSILDAVIETVGVDLGSFNNPANFDVDGGGIN